MSSLVTTANVSESTKGATNFLTANSSIDGYNKRVPPITLVDTAQASILPAKVNVSIKLVSGVAQGRRSLHRIPV